MNCLFSIFKKKLIKVICDTNIWYDIAEGRIKKNSFSKYRLHPTYVNLVELARTPNLLHDLSLVQRTVKSLYENNGGIYETNPIEFIIKKQYPHYRCKDMKYKSILKFFEKLMQNVNSEVENSLRNHMRKSIKQYKDDLQKTADSVNDLLPGIRENIKKTTEKKVHRNKKSLPIFFDIINFFVEEYTKGTISLDIAKFPWDEIELFISVWDNYFKELEISPNQKFQSNDWFDLFGMVYVDKDSKYSTSETKWIRLISKDENIKSYLLLLN